MGYLQQETVYYSPTLSASYLPTEPRTMGKVPGSTKLATLHNFENFIQSMNGDYIYNLLSWFV